MSSYIACGGGGMCNQIKKLINVLRLSDDSKTELSFFNTLLKTQYYSPDGSSGRRPINTWRFMVLDTDVEIPDGFCEASKDLHGYNHHGRHVDLEYLRVPVSFRQKIISVIQTKLQPNNYIDDVVENYIRSCGPYASAHIRSFKSDFHMSDHNTTSLATQRNNDWKYDGRKKCIDFINGSCVKKWFIAYDSFREYEIVKNACPTKEILHYPKICDGSKKNYEADFIDMLLLSKGTILVLNKISTFSEVAWYFGGCNENIYIY